MKIRRQAHPKLPGLLGHGFGSVPVLGSRGPTRGRGALGHLRPKLGELGLNPVKFLHERPVHATTRRMPGPGVIRYRLPRECPGPYSPAPAVFIASVERAAFEAALCEVLLPDKEKTWHWPITRGGKCVVG